MKLLELYGHVADDAGWVVNNEGFVSKKIIGREETEPLLVKGKRMVFPTEAFVKSSSDDLVVFHPLREDVVHPDTDVIDALRLAINTKLNITTCWLMSHLLILATSPDEQAKMNPDQHEFLSLVKNAKEDTIEDMKKIMGTMKLDAKAKTSVSIFTKKGGMIDGKKHNCVGIVKFPMYEDLTATVDSKDKPEVFGVKLASKKNRDTLIAVFKYIYPHAGEPEYYNFGSNSSIAAFPDALMHSYAKLASDLNQVIDTFADLLIDPDEFRIKAQWYQAFDNLGTMINEIRMVPPQVSDVVEVATAPAKTSLGLSKAPAKVGYVQAEPAKLHTEKGLDFAAFMDASAQAARAQQLQSFGFGGNGGFQQKNDHPAFAALAPQTGFQQKTNHPFAEFQNNRSGFGNSNSGRGSFGGGGGGFGGGGMGF